MEKPITLQGRELDTTDIQFIRRLIEENPRWSRRKISIALSEAWNWRNAKGDLKDMACRSLLVKLHNKNYVQLPDRRQKPSNRMTTRIIPEVTHNTDPIEQRLKELRPIKIINVHLHKEYDSLYSCLLSRYHYLGYSSPVGENMKYLILDSVNRPLACLLFGSAAWSSTDRDTYIGWDSTTRKRNINLTTNNTRFLILPWVSTPHLASHILASVSRRIAQDWVERYGHGVYLLETFVEQDRFKGTCYIAANWCFAGQTKGRSRNDKKNTLSVPVKAIYLYPLNKKYRAILNA